MRPAEVRERASLTILDALLYLCPRDFRGTYRGSIREDFSAGLCDQGPRYALLAYIDVVSAALRERGALILQDLAFALRTARKSLLFSAIVTLTMATAIGANVAVYSVLAGVVLKPLPYPHPDRLAFGQSMLGRTVASLYVSLTDAKSVRDQQRSFSATSAWIPQAATLLGHGPPTVLAGQLVTHEFFDVFEARPELGRFFIPSDEKSGSAREVVVSDKLWRTVFRSDPHVIGETVRLSDTPARIVGVAPATFIQPDVENTFSDTAYWSILKDGDTGGLFGYGPDNYSFTLIVLRKPGVTIEAANADLARIFKTLEKKYPATNALISARLVPLREDLFGPIQATMLTIFAVVAGVLLIGCVTVTNLLLSRAASRVHELSLRFAIGASRARIVAQLFTETLLYVGTGGLLGLGFAAAGIRAFIALRPPGIPRIDNVTVDLNVVLYTVGLVALATLLAGLVPALSFSRPDLSVALKAGGRSGDSSRGARVRGMLVSVEIALALVLVTTSGLSLRSFEALTSRPIGLDPSNVYVAEMGGFSDRLYSNDDTTRRFQHDILTKLATTPGTEHAAFVSNLPFYQYILEGIVRAVGAHAIPWAQDNGTDASAISPNAFSVLRIPLLHGRIFNDRDTKGSAPVVIVDQEFVKRYLKGNDGVGQLVKIDLGIGANPPYRRVVGVVGDTRHTYANEVGPTVYLPSGQLPIFSTLIVRSSDSPHVVGEKLARVLAQVDPTLQPPKVETLSSRMAQSVGRARVGAILLGALALIALILAIAGVYGVVSYDVGQRMHEIGIRVALGASTRAIVVLVLRSALVLASSGIAIGLGLAALSSRLIEAQLVDVSALDPRTYLVVVVLLAVAVFVASLIPALRAARVDPVTALRYE